MTLILSHNDAAASLKALSEDIDEKPEQLWRVDPALIPRIRELVRDVEIDLDAPLSCKDE
ncbi:hypothetical protein V6M93_00560 [Pectobacterium brasiliense]|uniref:hypothetical protein n=1 Tax=Pectobacterium brasiliense TaxID=180957 RepID=UPI00366A76FA